MVAGDEGSARLDRVLAARRPELSRSRLKALILAGAVHLKASAVRAPAYHVSPGDTIIIDVPEAAPAEPKGEEIALDIVFEDDDIIVINKPKGLVVHPAAGHETGTLVNALIAHCGASLSGIGGVRRPGIVHRLDKDTTGLMVVAKNDLAHASLSAQFADHGRTGAMRRGYMAFAWGGAEPASRHGGRADRSPPACAREDGGAPGRPRGGDALGDPGQLCEARRQARRRPARLRARDRPHPSDPRPPRSYRSPPDGRRRLWPAFQDQGQPARP
ncbi:23S rRNA-/tRNA-specific pseudouridylate synthase [Bradyrhizobium liaoningense]